MHRLILILCSSFVWSLSALAKDCHCEQLFTADTVFSGHSRQGRGLRLRIPFSPVTTESGLAYLCHEPSGVLAQARLWMPEHGHGTAPTRLLPMSASCTRIERMRLSMAGTWELQLRYTDGDLALLSFEVQRP